MQAMDGDKISAISLEDISSNANQEDKSKTKGEIHGDEIFRMIMSSLT